MEIETTRNIPYNPNYETIIERIVSGERPFSEGSIRLYQLYKRYIECKEPEQILPVHKAYLDLYDSLPKYRCNRSKKQKENEEETPPV